MSTNVSIKDVAEAAGVSKSTVSRVINGKGNSTRICPTTQARVLAVAQQLGYQTNLLAQNISLGRGTGLGPNLPNQEASRKLANFICLVLSTTSPTDALALIPSLDPVLTRAGYRLIVITVPDDPAAGQARVAELLTAGITGFICCPTLYPAVMKTVAGTRPVIVLWAGAARAVVSILNGESVEQEAPSKPVATPATTTPQPVAVHTITPITPNPTPTTTPPAPLPQPVAILKPLIVTPPLVFEPKPTPVQPPPFIPPVVQTELPPPASTPEPPPTILPEAPNPAVEPEPPPQIQDPVVPPVEAPPASPPSIPPPPLVVTETTPPASTPEPPPTILPETPSPALEPEPPPQIQDPVVPPVEAPPPVVVPETTPPAMTPEPEPVVIEPPHTILPTPETIPETPETEPASPITSFDDTQK